MKLRNLGFGALTGVLLTAPLIAILYMADKWLDLSYPPFETFDWTAGMLPGAMVTFGIGRDDRDAHAGRAERQGLREDRRADHGDHAVPGRRSRRDDHRLRARGEAHLGRPAAAGSPVRSHRRHTGRAHNVQHRAVDHRPDPELHLGDDRFGCMGYSVGIGRAPPDRSPNAR